MRPYKGGRLRLLMSFREQFPFIRELLTKWGFVTKELAQYEAGRDIIGTLDKLAEQRWF